MEDSVKKFIVGRLEKKAKLPTDAILDSFNYIDTGFVDSLGIMRFVVDIETKFDVEITEADMESAEFRTIGGLTSLICSKLNCGSRK